MHCLRAEHWLVSTQPFPWFAAAYYRGAMGILLVYDVTDEASFNNIRNWMRNIEQHASDNVNKVYIRAWSVRAVPAAAYVEQQQPHSRPMEAWQSLHHANMQVPTTACQQSGRSLPSLDQLHACCRVADAAQEA